MTEVPSPEIALQTDGTRLREAREQKGVTLEEAARVTRIAKAYLKALEDDSHDRLPNEAYARGFQRAYARYLDLPAEEFAGSTMKSVHDSIQPDGRGESEADREPPARKTRPARRWLFISLLLSLSCAILLAAIFINREKSVQGTDVHPDKHPAADTKSVSPPAPQPGLVDGNETPSQDETKVAVPFETKESPGKGIILRLRAIEDGNLDITIDNMISQHYDLKAGDIIEWKGEKVFSLDLQNAGGVEAELNGRVLAPFGEKGQQAHIRLSPAGVD